MRNTSQVPTAATAPARIGDMSAGRITLPTTPSSLDPSPAQFTPFSPRPASVEPMRPPNSACEELDGRPSSQVSRFQTMPPMRPASTMSSSADPPPWSSAGSGAPDLSWIFTTAFVTVSATSMLRNAPTRLSTAESVTATLGFNAPVAMDVAIAFAVSWKPLVKSKASAVMTTSTRRMNGSTAMILRPARVSPLRGTVGLTGCSPAPVEKPAPAAVARTDPEDPHARHPARIPGRRSDPRRRRARPRRAPGVPDLERVPVPRAAPADGRGRRGAHLRRRLRRPRARGPVGRGRGIRSRGPRRARRPRGSGRAVRPAPRGGRARSRARRARRAGAHGPRVRLVPARDARRGADPRRQPGDAPRARARGLREGGALPRRLARGGRRAARVRRLRGAAPRPRVGTTTPVPTDDEA